jgi:hypothetical protein
MRPSPSPTLSRAVLAVLLPALLAPAPAAVAPAAVADELGTPPIAAPPPSPAALAADPLAYTVVRTPPGERVELPPLVLGRNVLVDRARVFPDRRVPDVFWYDRGGVSFGLVHQRARAPLVMLIAGTGASFDSDTNRLLARTLHGAGMHVLGLPSPTHPNFIVNASETGVPGRPEDDARDLYRAMRAAYERVRGRIEVSAFYLAGYSLGALHAAWVARLDERERAFGFEKVLLLNPPVSLYSSVRILDGMYDRHVPKDPAGARRFVDGVFARFAEVYVREQDTSLDGDFLYRAYERLRPGRDALETLIGISFRLASANLAFASDVVSRGGYMVPPDAELDAATSLTNLYEHAIHLSFDDYIDGLYVPFFRARDPSFTKERAIAEAGLGPIEDYLRGSPKIGLVTSRDDIILAPGDIAWLEGVFGPRATIFADGGHCGIYQRRDLVDALTRFFKG